jgi:hypothetical protein
MQVIDVLSPTKVQVPDLPFALNNAISLFNAKPIVHPGTDAEELRRVADALGFVIVARKGLRNSAFPGADSREGRAIAAFDTATKGMDSWVITPVMNLDPRSADLVDIYAGTSSAIGAVQALQAVAPVLRDHGNRIAALERDAVRRAEEARRWDPLIFATPAGADIGTFHGQVVLGPCWGPDLPLITDALKGLKANPIQGRALARYW